MLVIGTLFWNSKTTILGQEHSKSGPGLRFPVNQSIDEKVKPEDERNPMEHIIKDESFEWKNCLDFEL